MGCSAQRPHEKNKRSQSTMGGGEDPGLRSRCCMRRGGRRRRRSRMGGRLPARRRPSSRLPCARARQCLDDRTLATRAESRSGSLIEWRSVSCPTSTRRLLRLNRPSSKGSSTSSSSERPIRSSVRCGRRTSRTSGFPPVRVSPRSAVALGRWRALLPPNPGSRRLLASTRHRSSSPRAEKLARNIANLKFVEGDARALPLEDGSLDVPRVPHHPLPCPRSRTRPDRGITGSRCRRAARHLRRRLRHDDVGRAATLIRSRRAPTHASTP